MTLTPEDLSALRRQRSLSRAIAVPLSLFVAATARLRFGYRLPRDISRIRAEIWEKLDAHDGPVIWAANHLTLIDSFLVYWAIFPFSLSSKEAYAPALVYISRACPREIACAGERRGDPPVAPTHVGWGILYIVS